MEYMTKEETLRAAEHAVDILRHYLPAFTQQFRDSNSVGNFYPPSANVEWTTGFCTGQYWLAWELTGEEAFREAALVQVDSFLARIRQRIDVDHHDMGFLYTPSCVAAWRLAGSDTGREAALLAADNLCARFQPKGEFLQAWGELGAPGNYRLIIDCLLNLPLLYWASETTGDPRYREIALAHTKTSLRHLVREDSSTYHTYFFDPETGAPVRGVTHQGYRDGSAWARGQAWGVYGTALAYRHTGDEQCVELFRRVTDYFIEHLPADLIPCWDLEFGEESGEPRDSSSAVIAACGMLEMSGLLPAEQGRPYAEMAARIAASLAKGYAVTAPEQSNGLLLHGVYAKSSPYNPVSDRGVDECNTWGDYFWLELLMRLSRDWGSYWS